MLSAFSIIGHYEPAIILSQTQVVTITNYFHEITKKL